MGLGKHMIEAIIREHLNKPILGEVLLIGRQTTYLSRAELINTIRENGVEIDANVKSMELDRTTVNRKLGQTSEFVSDAAAFKLLGASAVKALDHSPYEGADVIHDLRYPIPSQLENITDFLVDGSTLDNVFTPSIVLQNYAKLVRPGGRLLLINAFSPDNTAYVMTPPLWYVDYFVMNKFSDCKVYVLVFIQNKITIDNTYWVDLDYLAQARKDMGRFTSPHEMVTIVFAEKGNNSTVDRLPNQQDYRSPEEWSEYLANLNVIRQSKRHHLVRSRSERVFSPAVSGHPFVDREYCTRP